MCARWEGLHAALVDSVTTLEMEQQFEQARVAIPELQRFGTVTSLLEFLGSEGSGSGLADKNAIYRALVHAVQGRTSWSPLATGVLWCGLWPGLDAVCRRQRRYFVDEPEELSSLIGVVFTTLVAELDLRRVQRVAATLIRSTGREVARARQRQLAIVAPAAPPRAEPPEETRPDGPATARGELADPGEEVPDPLVTTISVLGIPVGLSTEAQAAAVHRWLLGVVGEDATWFLAVAVLGERPEQVAEQLGLSAAGLRKRIQRIRARLRRSWSQIASENGMCQSGTQHKTAGPFRRR